MAAKKRWHVEGMLVYKSPSNFLCLVYLHLFIQSTQMLCALLPEAVIKNFEDSEQS